jgi:hypothetical protein
MSTGNRRAEHPSFIESKISCYENSIKDRKTIKMKKKEYENSIKERKNEKKAKTMATKTLHRRERLVLIFTFSP